MLGHGLMPPAHHRDLEPPTHHTAPTPHGLCVSVFPRKTEVTGTPALSGGRRGSQLFPRGRGPLALGGHNAGGLGEDSCCLSPTVPAAFQALVRVRAQTSWPSFRGDRQTRGLLGVTEMPQPGQRALLQRRPRPPAVSPSTCAPDQRAKPEGPEVSSGLHWVSSFIRLYLPQNKIKPTGEVCKTGSVTGSPGTLGWHSGQ